jgi:hypothetical protein
MARQMTRNVTMCSRLNRNSKVLHIRFDGVARLIVTGTPGLILWVAAKYVKMDILAMAVRLRQDDCGECLPANRTSLGEHRMQKGL